MKKYYHYELHDVKPGYYWFSYPGYSPRIMRITRNKTHTNLLFPYPDETRLELGRTERDDIIGLVIWGPIPEPQE